MGELEMKKEFIRRIFREGVVDTRKYRYVIKWCAYGTYGEIRRIPLKYLDTTKALDKDNWELVLIV